ncbi:MAG: TrkH family potassium uptake protein, partial [Christensenellaceae bacterium]
MSYKTIASYLGKILLLSAFFYIVPCLVALIYGEYAQIPALAAASLVALAAGGVLLLFREKGRKLRTKESLVVVGLSWILISAIGALPFFLDGCIPNYLDCLFETVSGFTTTGATILTNFDLPKSMHFWRAFTHWLGGMGILVFMLAILPSQDAGSFQLMKFESPGPQVGKLVSKVRLTATILYLIYFVFTLSELFLLKLGGMDWFNSFIVSMSTAGTGGFASTEESIREFDSVYIDVVVTVFMLVFSVNFNLYYLMLLKKFSSVFRDEELRFYLLFLFGAILAVTLDNTFRYLPYGKDFFTSLRYSAFAVTSVSSTTGFMTADFAQWSLLSQIVLLLVMCVGAMAGSTGGGLKASRFLILLKAGRADTLGVLRPAGIHSVKYNKKQLSRETVTGVRNYFVLYTAIFVFACLLLSFDPSMDFLTDISAVIACYN